MCTMIGCAPESMGKPECREYAEEKPCPDGCQGPRLLAPNVQCQDGSVGGPTCGPVEGKCVWHMRACPEPTTAGPTTTAAPAWQVPENCVSWFDGCNVCSRQSAEAPAICTLRFCSPDQMGEPECRRYAATTTEEAPTTVVATKPTVTRMCKEGVDQEGRKCRCKSSGCASCVITTVGEERTESCKACEEGRHTVEGRCPSVLECKGGQFTLTGEECSCGNKHCHRCMVDASGKARAECLTCRNRRFKHNGECLVSCPEGMAHVGRVSSKFGRTCSSPFKCEKGTVRTAGHEREGKNCKCHSAKCQDCHFYSHQTEINAECTTCNNKLFHHEGECKAECPEGMTHHGVKAKGRSCRDAFKCSYEAQAAGKCQCHKSCKKRGCVWEANNAPKEHTCNPKE